MFGVRWWTGLGVENVLELVMLLVCLVVKLVVGGVVVLVLFRIALMLVLGAPNVCCDVADWGPVLVVSF